MRLFKIEKNNLIKIFFAHIKKYPCAVNLNYAYSFGFILGFMLLLQIITGILLSMFYVPHVTLAYDSIEFIMRDVPYGWLIRYLHSNGASFFFIAVYIHIGKGLYYQSYAYPNILVWYSGLIIFILMMMTAFLGYVLPWGQMSFWGATVITNLFTTIPFVGDTIVSWIWGGYSIDNATLQKFYSFHFLLPFIIAGFVFLHLIFLHQVGSTNPLGIDENVGKIPFYPYYFLKDIFATFVFFSILMIFVLYFPNKLGHTDNYIQADPLITPTHIVPEWYFLPFYAILRSFANKVIGVIIMFCSILILFLVPFLDFSIMRSPKFRPFYCIIFWLWIAVVILLGWIGTKPMEAPYIAAGQFLTFCYFGYFLIIIPLLTYLETKMIMKCTKILDNEISNNSSFKGIISNNLISSDEKEDKNKQNVDKKITNVANIETFEDFPPFFKKF